MPTIDIRTVAQYGCLILLKLMLTGEASVSSSVK